MEPGQQIDIWVVDRKLGSGAAGSVYRCHNVDAERILAAIKVLNASLAASSDHKTRFVREAEILFRLDHPNIVRVRNIRMDSDPPYLEMDFVVGTSLEEHLRESGAVPLRQAMELMEQLADALTYLHQQNVRHRDIKPSNLLLTEQGALKLVDFGLALEADAAKITREGMAFGTVAYVPPEWLDPEQLDPVQWDLYATGVVFYEVLTGGTGFQMSGEGSSRKQLMQMMLRKQTAPPLDIGDGFPSDLGALVKDLTRVEPSERPQTAAEVKERLAAVRETLDRFGWEASNASLEDTSPISKRRPDAVSTEPPAAPEPRKPRAWYVTPLAALPIALGLVAAIGLASLALFGGSPTTPVEVVVEGLPQGMAFDLEVSGHQATAGGEGIWHLAAPIGTDELHWAAGEGCAADDCHAGDCPEWCGAGTLVVHLVESDQTRTIELVIEVPAPNVTFQLLKLKEQRKGRVRRKARDVRVTLGDRHAGIIEGYRAGLLGVAPGNYDLVVVLGECEEEEIGCWPDGACTVGCSSLQEQVVIPWQSETVLRDIWLPAPAEEG